MDRRQFLRNVALIAAGAIAADQLELLERLAPRRLYFYGENVRGTGRQQFYGVSTAEWDRLLREVYMGDTYGLSLLERTIVRDTPLARRVIRPIARRHGRGYDQAVYEALPPLVVT